MHDASETGAESITRRTFRLEMVRALPVGIIETAATTFAVLIAIRWFQAGPEAKATVQAAARGGLLASIFVVPLLYKLRFRAPVLAGWLHFMAGVSFATPAIFSDSLPVFISGVGAGMFFFAVSIPLFTQIYRYNYPENKRGRLFSNTIVLRAAVSIMFGFGAGAFLEANLDGFPRLLYIFSICSFASAALTWTMPDRRMDLKNGGKSSGGLWRAFAWVGRDRDFRKLLVAWMLVGTGNLMALSVYVEYLANPEHGFDYDSSLVALLTVAVPVTAKMISTVFWGRLFDRINFFLLRVILNMVFTSAIICVFVGSGLGWFYVGFFLHGVALGGGNVAWSLWVTKLAPPDRVAEYMSVHTFLTGVRGVGAAYLGFYLIGVIGGPIFGGLCAAIITLSTILILPRARLERARRHVAPLSDDVDV